ncbi:hypothetical protein EGH25_08620 [Haladaptatus sp. F3-133]|uniref:Uncharacterized protein n=1 Tax=Halorutilus salinus TaxID=2487751 RepID=A0A9Q4GH37_9EURY|nr:hypothetical protein [Halorutilus salinus]MCX2819412.1 hypothetical protein [Halorutilus salinus]
MNYLEDDRVRIGAIFAGLAVSGLVCIYMIADGWTQKGITWHLAYGAVDVLGLGIGTVFVLPVGFFVGLASLVLLDDYRRPQGVFLWVVILIGTVVLYLSDVFVTRISWTEGTVLFSLVLGVAAGLYLGGLTRDELSSELREFPRAISLVFKLSAVAVVLAFLEASLAYRSPIVTTAGGFDFRAPAFNGLAHNSSVVVGYAVFSVVFLSTLRGFRDYANDRSIVVLGPTGSGKTTLIAGLEMTQRKQAERNGDITTDANPLLRQVSDDIEFDKNFSRIGSTEGMQPFKFRFTKGNLLKRISTVRAVDHSGQDLTQFRIGGVGPAESAEEAYKLACIYHDSAKRDDEPDALESTEAQYRSIVREIRAGEVEFEDLLPETYVDEDGATSGPELTRNLISDMVEYSDVVILLLPAEDFLDDDEIADYMGEDWLTKRPAREKRDYMTKYVELMQRYGDKDFVFISTMADLATDAFTEESHEFDLVDPNQPESWREFNAYVEKCMRDNVGSLGAELNTMDSNRLGEGDIIYPVYFDVETDEDGEEEINLRLRGSMDPMRGAEDVLEEVGG